jgi:hypothetical protein
VRSCPMQSSEKLKRQWALARQGRLEKAIDKAEAEAESRFDTAQPILAGHHF